jgi:hypothetical protein
VSFPLRNLEVVDEAMAHILREKTEAQRLAIGNGLWVYARNLLRSILRQENPDWTDEQIQRETARRLSHGAV